MYRVIIVEDDKRIAEGICNCLADWGMEARQITDFRRVMEEIEGLRHSIRGHIQSYIKCVL